MAIAFETEYGFCQKITGDISPATLVYFKQFVNLAYRILSMENEWAWLRHSFHLSLEGTYTTGTVSVTKGSTAGTSAGATFNVTWADREIQLPSGAIYALEGTTPFPTTGTFTLATAAAKTETAVVYTLFRRRYTLPARMRTIEALWPSSNPRALIQPCGADGTPMMMADAVLFRDPPVLWTPADSDTTNNIFRIEVYPIPANDQAIMGRGLRFPADLTSDGTYFLFPEDFYDAFRQKLLELVFQWRSDYARASEHRNNYLIAVDRLRKRQQPDGGRSDALTLDDSVFSSRWDPRDGLPRHNMNW